MYLCTKDPTVKIDGERIVLSAPSGKETVQIALSLNQLLKLRIATIKVMDDAFAIPEPAIAEVIPMKRRRA